MRELTLQQANDIGTAQMKVCRAEAVVDLLEHYLVYPTGEAPEDRLAKASEVVEILGETVQELKELLMSV